MCRLPLSILFPAVFPRNSKNNAYASNPISANNGEFIHAGTGKNGWTPSSGGGKDDLAINLTSIRAGGLKDNTSEEFILPAHQTSETEQRKTIHKVTNYAVTYDDDDAGSKESVAGAVPKSHRANSKV